VVVLTVAEGAWGLALGLAVVLPMLVKRALGNTRPPGLQTYVNRLLYDADRHGPRPTLDTATLEHTM
jgi:hypothetical protein